MKKVLLPLVVMAVAFMFACASQQPAATDQGTAAPTVSSSGPATLAVSASNETLRMASNELDVFPPSRAALSANNRQMLGSKLVQIVGEVVNKVPEGYVVQITGHSAKVRLDEDADRVSTARAKAVYDTLVRGGISASKLTYKGIGNSQPKDGFGPKAKEQRRVTFMVVPR